MSARSGSYAWIAAAWSAAAFFIYPIPHTIALRNLILVSGTAAFLFVPRDARAQLRGLARLRMAGILLVALTAWITLAAAGWGLARASSLSEICGDWLASLIVVASGMLAVCAEGRRCYDKQPGRLVAGAMALGLLANIVWLIGDHVWHALAGTPLPLGVTPFAQRDYHSTINNMAFALLLGEGTNRVLRGRRLLPWSNLWLLAALGATLVANYLLVTRNGSAVMVAMLILAAAVLLTRRDRFTLRRIALAAAAVAAVAMVTALSLTDDPRWSEFFQSARVALNIDANHYWLQPDASLLPRLPDGRPADQSAYLRIAYAAAAMHEIARHPFGVGYGHEAFGRAVNVDYHIASVIRSSHSGLLDFTIANGLPGVALWLALCVVLMRFGWQSFRESNAAGLMLLFSVFNYLARCAVDGHLSGWRLESYALSIGILLAAACRPEKLEGCA